MLDNQSDEPKKIVKILHIYKDFDPPVHGGIERHIALMCRFQSEWADVEALTCSRSFLTRKIERDGISITEVGEWGRFQSTPFSPLFPFYMRMKKADVIVVHVPNPTAELGYLMTRPKGKLIVRYHSDVVRQAAAMRVYGPFLVKFLRKADIILATSERYVETSSTLQQVQNKCRVVPLGIIPEDFQNPDYDRVEELKQKYGGRYVLFFGRHRYYKGIEYLVEAAEAINAPVVIAGEGPESDRYKALVRDLGVEVFFPGSLTHEELVAHLHGCAVMAFPSIERSEAFGISIMEAHACGKPVVATKIGTGVEFANLDGKTGLNVAPRNSEVLAEAVNLLLSDSAMCKQMGDFARERVETELTASRIARIEFEIYNELLKS